MGLRWLRTPSPALLGKVARSAGWGGARCFGASRGARPTPRTFTKPDLLSTPPSAFGPLPRFAEKGARHPPMTSSGDATWADFAEAIFWLRLVTRLVTVTRPQFPIQPPFAAFGFGPRLPGASPPAEQGFGAAGKGGGAERTADQFRAAQRGEGGIVGVGVQNVGETRDPVRERGACARGRRPRRANARRRSNAASPAPWRRGGREPGSARHSGRLRSDALHPSGPNRSGPDQMLFIHRDRTEAAPPFV
jgi:hypothetical protein